MICSIFPFPIIRAQEIVICKTYDESVKESAAAGNCPPQRFLIIQLS